MDAQVYAEEVKYINPMKRTYKNRMMKPGQKYRRRKRTTKKEGRKATAR